MAKLGLIAVPIDGDIATMIPTPKKMGGLLVMAILDGGSAAGLGIRPADIIYAINEKPIGSVNKLQQELLHLPQDQMSALQIERDGALRRIEFCPRQKLMTQMK